jgi:hypothetical protein
MPIRRQLRRFGSHQQIDEGQLSSSSTSPVQNRKPMMTSTPKKQLIRPDVKCIECCRVANTSNVTKVTPPEYTSFDSDKFINASKFQPKEVQRLDGVADGYTETCSFKTQTEAPITHRNV